MANGPLTPADADVLDVRWTCGDCDASSDAPHHSDGCPASGRPYPVTRATDPNLPTGLVGINTDDLLVLADVLDQVRQYTLAGHEDIIDQRSHGECARILDASLEGDLRANLTRILSAAGFLDLGGWAAMPAIEHYCHSCGTWSNLPNGWQCVPCAEAWRPIKPKG